MPKHILVVEPQKAVGDTISAMLQSAGYRVTAVQSGEPMRAFLDNVTFDAVILDATLRGEHSDSLAAHVKELRLPLVLISGRDAAMVEARDRHLQLLHKPFRIQELFAALDEAFSSGEFGRRNDAQ
jgi:DNA-binding response OmpR family regulator